MADPALIATLAWRLVLALFAGLGVLATTVLYVVGAPQVGAGAAVGVAVACLGLARSFRQRGNPAVRRSARIAERSLGTRRR